MEFPYWYSRRWNELEGEIPIIRRAEALKSGFEHLTPTIYPDELIVMGKAAYLRGSFTMPWLSESFFLASEEEMYKEASNAEDTSTDSLITVGTGGGNVTQSAGNVISIAGKFGIRKEELTIMLETAKKWKGKSVEDIGHKYEQLVPGYDEKEAIMQSLICMFDSGYTIPQGREVMNYYYPLQYGFDELIKICNEKISEVAGKPEMDRLYFYKACSIILKGIKAWILNYAEEAEFMASLENDNNVKKELLIIAEILKNISSKPPKNFREALQLIWTCHIAVLNEDAASGLAPGRIGQVLYPYWKKDIENGSIDELETLELMECLRVKFTEIDCFASMGVVGGVLSGSTFNNLCVGGWDKDRKSAVNELEMLIVEAGITCATPQPTLSILYDEKLPEEFLLKCVECVKTGVGYPAWINNRTAMDFILRNYADEGMNIEEATAYSIGGCLETSAGGWMPLNFDGKIYYIPGGTAPATSVGVHFISLPKILELVLFDGVDARTGKRIFPSHGKKLETFEELLETVKYYFSRAVNVLALTNNIQHDAWRKITPSVVNSILKPDCLEKGKGIGDQGARYNTTFNIEVTGTINLVNSFSSLKKNVYEDKKFSLSKLTDAIKANFGFKTAQETGSFSMVDQIKTDEYMKWNNIYKKCVDAPKYGNNDSYADSILKDWQEWFCKMAHDYVSLYDKPMYACMISVSTHGPMGAAALAGPDGRLCGTAFADGSMSAYPGTDKNGPYSLFSSATCWEHSHSQNSQLNMKVHPSAIHGREGSKKFLEFIKAYMRKGGFHVQFNIVDSKMLKDAQKHPDNYRGLMVRVAGFTQYWAELGKQIQDEVISRTEYEQI